MLNIECLIARQSSITFFLYTLYINIDFELQLKDRQPRVVCFSQTVLQSMHILSGSHAHVRICLFLL